MSDDAIDMQEVMDRVQNDQELLIELLQIFSDDYVEKRKMLEEAVGKNDFDEVKSIAHALKGSSGNISAKKLRLSFLELEQMAKTQDFSKAKETLSLIDQQFNELKDFISDKFKK